MADEESEDEYELLPHREIEELKAELGHLNLTDLVFWHLAAYEAKRDARLLEAIRHEF